MNPSRIVSIHPYFKAKPGKLAEVKALLPELVAKTQSETANLYYDYTFNGDEFFCREAYVGAEGLLFHLTSIGELLGKLTEISDLHRLELHGSAEELEKLRAPLADYNPAWFVYECGVTR